jgi:hypothetical protein
MRHAHSRASARSLNVVPAKAGTHNHRCLQIELRPLAQHIHLWLWVPARASLGRDDGDNPNSISGCGFKTQFRIPAAGFARGLPEDLRPIKQRAWGMPGAQCTRSRACSVVNTRVSHRRSPGNHPAFPHAMVLRLISCSPRRSGFLVTVTRESLALANLTPASRRQDHTTSPSAFCAVRQERIRVHRIPPRVDDVAQRPSFGTGRGESYS